MQLGRLAPGYDGGRFSLIMDLMEGNLILIAVLEVYFQRT